MGATSWRYYTTYQGTPEEALQRLRAEVFARKDYVDMTGPLEDQMRQMFKRFGEDPDSPAAQARMDETLRLQRAIDTGDVTGLSSEEKGFARRVRGFSLFARLLGAAPPPSRNRPPRSIEELLEQAEESGTHSILDIEHVASKPGFGVAAPLAQSSLQKIFGTTEPTHAQVEEHWDDVAEKLKRWHCRYLVVYREGQPHEFAFVGCSGD